MEFSLWTRSIENNAVLETYKMLNIGVVAYSPLGRGFLTGSEKSCTPAQLALAWVLAKDKSIVPIPGTKNPARIIENLKALEINLTVENMAYLDHVSKEYAPKQSRYAEASMQAYKLSE
jgi:aryl-alcohol dehydrogenase-like predicted oxidoreductase